VSQLLAGCLFSQDIWNSFSFLIGFPQQVRSSSSPKRFLEHRYLTPLQHGDVMSSFVDPYFLPLVRSFRGDYSSLHNADAVHRCSSYIPGVDIMFRSHSDEFEDIQNPTQRHNCQNSVNPTHPAKPAYKSANPTHFAASDTVFWKSDTTPGNPTHPSAILAGQSMPSQLIRHPASFPPPHSRRHTPRNGETAGASDTPPRHLFGAVSE
jgi:hypothetical protein